MQPSLLELLVCPECRGELSLTVTSTEAIEILTGSLTCDDCGRTFPIVQGVPRLLPDTLTGEEQTTADAFGWQWKHFANLLGWDRQREQFLDWLAPLGAGDFHHKVVVDAGCGMGRLTEVAATFQPKHLIGVDLSSAVEVAWWRLRGRPNVHVIQGDIYNLPLRRDEHAQVDLAYSVGVLHHLPDPERGYQSLFSHLRPGGRISAWLYGKEGNGWVENVVTPIRERLTSRLPRRALLGLSYALTVPLHAVALATDRVPGADHVPYASYLRWLANYPFRHNLHVVFDHLGPPIAFYLSREDLVGWAERVGARLLSLTARNENSWRMLSQRPPA